MLKSGVPENAVTHKMKMENISAEAPCSCVAAVVPHEHWESAQTQSLSYMVYCHLAMTADEAETVTQPTDSAGGGLS